MCHLIGRRCGPPHWRQSTSPVGQRLTIILQTSSQAPVRRLTACVGGLADSLATGQPGHAGRYRYARPSIPSWLYLPGTGNESMMLPSESRRTLWIIGAVPGELPFTDTSSSDHLALAATHPPQFRCVKFTSDISSATHWATSSCRLFPSRNRTIIVARLNRPQRPVNLPVSTGYNKTSLYRVGQKTAHGFHCNNFVYSQSIIIIFGTHTLQEICNWTMHS